MPLTEHALEVFIYNEGETALALSNAKPESLDASRNRMILVEGRQDG